MARCSVPTLLSLDQFAAIAGMDLRHFNSVTSDFFPERPSVKTFWYQHAWQDIGAASREELGYAIADAERLIAEQLGYWPAPEWITSEFHGATQRVAGSDPDLLRGGPLPAYMSRLVSQMPSVRLRWRKFIAPGRRFAEELDPEVLVDRLDLDGDGYDETAEITVAGLDTAGWRPEEVVVTHDGDDARENQIRYLRIQIAADTVVIRGHITQFVVPILWENGHALDGDDPDTFLYEVAVHRVGTSTLGEEQAAIEFLYPQGTHFDLTYGTMLERIPETSFTYVNPATWDEDSETWQARIPRADWSHLRAYYYAGHPYDGRGWVDNTMARAIASLATARIAKTYDAYGPPENRVQYWQMVPEGAPYAQLVCPWGPQNGAWEAYQTVTRVLAGVGAMSL